MNPGVVLHCEGPAVLVVEEVHGTKHTLLVNPPEKKPLIAPPPSEGPPGTIVVTGGIALAILVSAMEAEASMAL